ncbi:hypothetical protein BDZ45DRAFT_748090 [Acephala macrosclerotiorum]|nr:hypothetical protein BDZ45DRAFT_748090 [Acephala macrosclerotiorum]
MDQPLKGKALARNDAQWDSLKDEIFRVYIAEDHTLVVTISMIEQIYQFKRSPRKWKDKLKQWNFEKNLSEKDTKILVAKAEKRAREEGKETEFLHHGVVIPPAKINNFKRRKTMDESGGMSPSAETPAAITYHTPRPYPDDEYPVNEGHNMNHLVPGSREVETINLDPGSETDIYPFRSEVDELGTSYPAIGAYYVAISSSQASQHQPSSDYSTRVESLGHMRMDHPWGDTMLSAGPSSVINHSADRGTIDIPLSMQMPPPPPPLFTNAPTIQHKAPTNDVEYIGTKRPALIQSAMYPHGWTPADCALFERLCGLQDTILGTVYRLDIAFLKRLVSSPSVLEWYLAGPFLSNNFQEFVSTLSLTSRLAEVFSDEAHFERAEFFASKAISGYLALYHRFQPRQPPTLRQKISPDDALRRVLFSFLCLYCSGHINFSHLSDCFEAISKKVTKSHGASYWVARHEGPDEPFTGALLEYIQLEPSPLSAQLVSIAAEFDKPPKKKAAKRFFSIVSSQSSQMLDSNSSYARKLLGFMMIFYQSLHYRQPDNREKSFAYLLSALLYTTLINTHLDFELWPENGGQWWLPHPCRPFDLGRNEKFIQQTFHFIFQFIMPPSSQIELRQQMKSLADRRYEIEHLFQNNDDPDALHEKKILDLDAEILKRQIDDLPDLGEEFKRMMSDDYVSELDYSPELDDDSSSELEQDML